MLRKYVILGMLLLLPLLTLACTQASDEPAASGVDGPAFVLFFTDP